MAGGPPCIDRLCRQVPGLAGKPAAAWLSILRRHAPAAVQGFGGARLAHICPVHGADSCRMERVVWECAAMAALVRILTVQSLSALCGALSGLCAGAVSSVSHQPWR